MRVLGLDMGVTVGMAEYVSGSAEGVQAVGGGWLVTESRVELCNSKGVGGGVGGVLGEGPGGEAVWVTECVKRAMKRGVDVVVIEDFILRMPVGGSSRSGLSSCRMGAAFEAASLALGAGYVVRFVSPSSAKGVWRDERLKSLGLWIKGKAHGRDAVRLVLCELRDAGVL